MKPDIRKYDAVIFDLFHTLVSLKNIDTRHCEAWDFLGVTEAQWRHALFSDAEDRLRGRIKNPNDVIRDIVRKIDPTITREKTERASRLRLRQFEIALASIEPHIMETIVELKGQGKALGLISNADRIEAHGWSWTRISNHFDSAVFSCHTGYVKPEKEIYLYSLEQLNLKPHQCLFIGDGGNNELQGAKAVGMDTAITLQFLENSTTPPIRQRRKHADFEIQHVSELL